MSELQLILGLPFAFALGVIVVLYFVHDPSRILKLWSFLALLLYRATRRWKRQAISTRIEAHLNAALNQLATEAPSAFPKSLQVKWVKDSEEHALLEEGSVIVRIREGVDHGKPLAAATMLFLEAGLIPQSRPYVERRVLRAIDLSIAFRVLQNSPYPSSINHLTNDYLDPSLEDVRTATFYEAADAVDRAGLLTRIVLREFSGLFGRLTGIRPNAAIRAETANFLQFASRVVVRTGEVPLSFFGRYLRCTVALIAKPEVYEAAGLALYRRNFRRDISLGVNVIYLLARGLRNLGVARAVAKWASEEGLISGSLPDKYVQPGEEGNPIPAECIVCFSSSVGRTVQVSPLEDALIAISQVIPETLTGDVEVVSIAREPRAVTKVLIRSDRYPNPVPVCIGPRRSRIRAIQAALKSDEMIDFIQWSPDHKANVIAALTPLSQDDLASVWIAPDSLSAKVYVRSPEAAHRAVGTEGVNLKAAQSLLNIHIDLETRDTAVPPEEELLEIIRYRVPEIEAGSIIVARIARRIGRASKVAVTSSVVPNPVRKCVGPGATTVNAIQSDLSGEHVTFVEWFPDDPERTIRQSLRPLRDRDIVEVQIQPSIDSATVIVRDDRAIAMAIGKEGDNVRLAERICGLALTIKVRS
jgi:transcription antitermination factor NusA-like protein